MTTTSCSAKRASGSAPCWWSQAALTWASTRAEASTGDRRGPSSTPQGKMAACRSTARWHSQDLAEAIRRLGCSTPWLRASSPTTARADPPGARSASQGTAVSAGARSCSPARYTNEGSWARRSTAPGATSWGTSKVRTRSTVERVST